MPAATSKASKASKAPETVSADRISFVAQQTWGIPVTGKDVRGLARGDTGPAVLPRYAERNADGTNRVHTYNRAEAAIVVRALATRKARRVPTVTADALLRALGLPLTAPSVSKAKAGTTGRKPATRPANRALGERAVRVKPTEPTEPTA